MNMAYTVTKDIILLLVSTTSCYIECLFITIQHLSTNFLLKNILNTKANTCEQMLTVVTHPTIACDKVKSFDNVNLNQIY